MCYMLMAIPFNLPSDEETEDNYRRLDQLLLDLYDVLRQIFLRPRFHQPPRDAQQVGESAAGGSRVPQPSVLPDVVLSTMPSRCPNCSRPSSSQQPNVPRASSAQSFRSYSSASDSTQVPPRASRPSTTAQAHCTNHPRDCTPKSSDVSRNSHSRRQNCRRRRRKPSCCSSHWRQQCNSSYNHCSPPESRLLASTCSNVQVSPDLVAVPRPMENWLLIGEQLRKIADEFKTSFKNDEGPKNNEENLKMEVKTSSLFSLLVPAPFRGSIWTTVILLVGWRLLARQR